MADREKVIGGLKNRSIVIRWLDVIVKDNWMWDHADAYAMVCKVARELLEEQPEIIRCKDCKYYTPQGKFCRYDGRYKTNSRHHYGLTCHSEWFCADGERKEEPECNDDYCEL